MELMMKEEEIRKRETVFNPPPPGPAPAEPGTVAAVAKISVKELSAWFGEKPAVRNVTIDFHEKEVTAIIGPSGCGKSTLLRNLNRMHETVPGARMEGRVFLDGGDIFAPQVDPVAVRRRVGMVFQKATPFPTFSIHENVAAGLRLNGLRDRRRLEEAVENSLKKAALWDEVKDHLRMPGGGLSGGQQQRLCIARALAVDPEVLLMDEPCSALDPISTARIEELIFELKRNFTIVIVTHNMQQAARVSQRTAFMLGGEMVEVHSTERIFTNPENKLTEEYITGRFG